MHIIRQEGRGDGFDWQGMQRRRNGHGRKTELWDTRKSRARRELKKSLDRCECWKRSNVSENDSMRSRNVRE